MPFIRVSHNVRIRAARALGLSVCCALAGAAPATATRPVWEGWSGLAPPALLRAASSPAVSVPAAAPIVVDGVSDQNMASWYAGPSGAVFRSTWERGASARIRFARYVVPWQAGASADNHYRAALDAWYRAASAARLIPDLAITTYTGEVPSPAEYREAVASLLTGHSVGYLEAWNEPNHVPLLRADPALAPEYMREAAGVCAAAGCTPIAGDFLDEPGSALYARQYRSRLSALGVGAPIWGIHPYEDINGVNAGSPDPEAEADAIAAQLQPGQRLWITEAGAYYCFGSRFSWSPPLAAQMQRAAAERLLGTVAPGLGAAHVFYYGVFAGRGRALCPAEDTELYDGAERPRPAAGVILAAAAR